MGVRSWGRTVLGRENSLEGNAVSWQYCFLGSTDNSPRAKVSLVQVLSCKIKELQASR